MKFKFYLLIATVSFFINLESTFAFSTTNFSSCNGKALSQISSSNLTESSSSLFLSEAFPDSSVSECAKYFYNLGNRAKASEKYKKAVEFYDKAIEVEPLFFAAWNNRGMALSSWGKNIEAIKSYNRAIEINPHHRFPWYNKGISHGRMKEYAKAIESYNKAIEISPDYVSAWYNKGNSLRDSGKFVEAIESFNKAISLQPDNFKAMGNIALILCQQQKCAKALKYTQQAVAIESDDALAWEINGYILFSLKQYDKAELSYHKSLDINPKNKRVKSVLRRIMFLKLFDRLCKLFG